MSKTTAKYFSKRFWTGAAGILFLLCWIGTAPVAFSETLFEDDFESGTLDKWDVINGQWDVIDADGTFVARQINGINYGVINIANFAASDFTMEARIWHVSGDQGANIYFRNDVTRANFGSDSGLWFGLSGALNALGWGDFQSGTMRIIGIVFSTEPFGWVRLRVKALGDHLSMSALREGIDNDFLQIFAMDGVQTFGGEGLGFVVAGQEVMIDDVVVYDEGGRSETLVGDFDDDGQVGLSDFVLFLDSFGTTSSSNNWNPLFDLDGDGRIGLSDFVIFLDNFGKVRKSAAK